MTLLLQSFRSAENDQSRAGIQRVRDWASSLKTDKLQSDEDVSLHDHDNHLGDEDIIISASVDEVMAPETLIRWESPNLHLKHEN